ncbi:hypothetical protein ABIB59_000908 [Citrobacter sp. UYEF32]
MGPIEQSTALFFSLSLEGEGRGEGEKLIPPSA